MQKYIDKEVAMQYLGGLEKVYIQLSQSFLESYAEFNEMVEDIYYQGQMENLHLIVHTLKGITLNLGATLMYDECVSFLKHLVADTITKEDIDNLIDVFSKTYNAINEEVNLYIKN